MKRNAYGEGGEESVMNEPYYIEEMLLIFLKDPDYEAIGYRMLLSISIFYFCFTLLSAAMKNRLQCH